RGARACQQRHIARELDAIAKALLGRNEDALARERIFTEPERFAEAAAACRHAAALPAPFVLLEAAAIVAERETRERRLVMCIRVRLVERDRTLEIGERLALLIERPASKPTANIRLD